MARYTVFAVELDPINTTAFGSYPSYAAGRTTVTLRNGGDIFHMIWHGTPADAPHIGDQFDITWTKVEP